MDFIVYANVAVIRKNRTFLFKVSREEINKQKGGKLYEL